MHREGKFSDNGRTRQKFSYPFKRSINDFYPCNHKNWNNGRKIVVELNMLPFWTITDCQSTGNLLHLNMFMHSEPKHKDTIPVLSKQAVKEILFVMVILLKTLIQLPIFFYYQSL